VHSPLQAFHRRNTLTFTSLVAGIAAMATASSYGVHAAGALLAFAALADTFDGGFARSFAATDRDRALGVQLDSLVDAVTFGVAPVVCVAAVAAPQQGPVAIIWWSAAAVYVVAAVSRLAFYNTSHEQTDGFIGLPVPVSALVWSSALFMSPSATVAITLFVSLAAAMVMPLPVPRPRRVALAAFACWPIGLIASHALVIA
jgi:CDP-diacylglycerol--serine O-phosphatidyltransferase